MHLGEYPTFFGSFDFVRQNNCQFGLDANIENIATYFNLFSVVKLILVKIWHNSCNEFMSWSQKCPDVSLPDVTWTVSLSLNKIGVMDMSYIMDSGQNRLYTTFPNIFSLISADPADLFHI